MKTYKLIKEYPGSLSLGTIFIVKNKTVYTDDKVAWITEDKINEFKDFFEEIIEKEYEILSFIQGSSNEIWLQDRHKGRGYWSKNGHITGPYTTEEILDHNIYSIYSIKRLSDGEIFTIGDRVETYYKDEPTNSLISVIKTINIYKEIYLNFYLTQEKMNIYFNTAPGPVEIRKTKQKLFTTEDGVDIYEDIYNYVYYINENYSLIRVECTKNNIQNALDHWIGYKCYSTKEKAEEYIIANEPCLSYNDIKTLDIHQRIYPHNRAFIRISTSRLKNLIKQKLNL